MKKLFVLIVMLSLTMLMTACGGGSSKNIVTEPGALTQAMESLQNKEPFKGKDLYVFQDVTLGYNKDLGNYIFIEVLQPGTENVDHYEYRGGSWSGPEPVKITGDGNMADNVILLKELHFDKLPDIYKAMQEQVKDKKDVKVKTDVVYRFWRGKWTVLIDAESDREEYGGEFKPDGTMIEVKKR